MFYNWQAWDGEQGEQYFVCSLPDRTGRSWFVRGEMRPGEQRFVVTITPRHERHNPSVILTIEGGNYTECLWLATVAIEKQERPGESE